MAGAIELLVGCALDCCAESVLLLEHAEKPTTATAARPTASALL
jgi:hypothetical protein